MSTRALFPRAGVRVSLALCVVLLVTAGPLLLAGSPAVWDDAYDAFLNTPLSVPAPGVLANDTVPAGEGAVAVKASDPAHGTLELHADGSFLYTPTAGYAGPDSFSYKITGETDSDVATVAITVCGWEDEHEFAYVPGGTNAGIDTDYGAYSLTVAPFYMGRMGVTKAKWDEVRAWGLENGYTDLGEGASKAEGHPVVGVGWYDCVKWCNARSEMEGRTPCYTAADDVFRAGVPEDVFSIACDDTASGYRLPTSIEREYAARGGLLGKRFPFGETIAHSQANYRSDAIYAYDVSPTRGYHPTYNDQVVPVTSPVGAFAANGYGLHDMAGNVWDWCWDWYMGATGTSRMLAGGSWNDTANACHVRIRGGYAPAGRLWIVGFRICSAAPGPHQLHAVFFDLGELGTQTGGGAVRQKVAHGGAAVAPTVAVPAGWSFVGWDTEFASVTGPLTVTAQYRPNTYTITFDSAGGTAVAPLVQDYLAEIAAPAPPTRVGHTFAGWLPPLPETMPAEDLAVTAQWTINYYAVTFEPGEHGVLPEGNPSVTVQAAYGSPVPEPPDVLADDGWLHAGWDWRPAARYGPPALVTQDLAVTALYAAEGVAWRVVLDLAGAVPNRLVFGMRQAATDGWDEGIDEACDAGGSCLVSADLSVAYAADYHGPAETAEFLLALGAGDVPVTVCWDAWGLPEGKRLSLYEVVPGDGRDAAGWMPVGNTALDMGVSPSLVAPADGTRYYVIRYGDELVYDLAVARGWNLVSLPVEPVDPAVSAVLGTAIEGGAVVEWDGIAYAATAEMHACIGYWVYALDTRVLLVAGTRVEQESIVLAPGWNLLGSTRRRVLADGSRAYGNPWIWDAEILRYRASDRLLPGRGHWIRSSEAATIPLGDTE